MRTFETKFESQDGISFYVQGWEPESGAPKAAVALVHGLGEHSGRYSHVAQVMTEAGYAISGLDLRGHGKSGGARGHASSLRAYMHDIRHFVELLENRYPGIPHFLYGHSLGGLLSLAYAIQYGPGLKGVMVTGPALHAALQNQKAKVAIVKLLGSILPSLSMPSGLDAATISRDPEIVQAYLNDPLVHYSTSLGFGKAALNAIDLCFARAKDFPAPLLIVHGTADKIALASGSEEFAKLVAEAGVDVTLKLWDDLYHEVHNEPEKAKVLRFMIAWLDKHL